VFVPPGDIFSRQFFRQAALRDAWEPVFGELTRRRNWHHH